MTTLLFIGGLGPMEIALIAGVLVLLFGASKLPELARSMGTATGEFQKGREEVEQELQEMREGESTTGDETVDDDEADIKSASDAASEPDVETEPETESETEPETDPDGSSA